MNKSDVKGIFNGIESSMKFLIAERDEAYKNISDLSLHNGVYTEEYKESKINQFHEKLNEAKGKVLRNLNILINKLYEMDKTQSDFSNPDFQTAVTLMNSLNSDANIDIVRNTLIPLYGNRVQLSAINSIMVKNGVPSYGLLNKRLYDVDATYAEALNKITTYLTSGDDYCTYEILQIIDKLAFLVGGSVEIKESSEVLRKKVYKAMGIKGDAAAPDISIPTETEEESNMKKMIYNSIMGESYSNN